MTEPRPTRNDPAIVRRAAQLIAFELDQRFPHHGFEDDVETTDEIFEAWNYCQGEPPAYGDG